MKKLFRICLLTAALFTSIGFVARTASALPILGEKLFYTGGDITVEVLSATAGYTSDLSLYLFSPTLSVVSGAYFGTNHSVGLITTVNPEDDFGYSIGDELMFGIYVRDSGYTYLMGGAARNPDGLIHAAVDNLGSNQYIVGFEDLYGGGDLDYDDNRFLFSGGLATSSEVPAPATLLLLVSGLAGLGFTRARRQIQ